jgi:hypothetical protein
MLHSTDRAPMRNIVFELRAARDQADLLAHDEGNIFQEHGEVRREAYQDALDIIARRFPELFEAPRPSLAMKTLE